MRNPWWTFVRVSAGATGLLMLLQVWSQLSARLAPTIMDGSPLASLPVSVELASLVGSLSFFLPAGVLVGAVYVGSRANVSCWHPRSVLLAMLAAGVFSFLVGGIVGPRLLHHTRMSWVRNVGVPEAEFEGLTANDWFFFRSEVSAGLARLSVLDESEARDDLLEGIHLLSASSHNTVSFALAAGLLLPLGLALGGTGQRLHGPLRGLRLWGMAAGLMALIFKTHMFAWTELVWLHGVPAIPALYLGSVLIPGLVLATLWWSGSATGQRE